MPTAQTGSCLLINAGTTYEYAIKILLKRVNTPAEVIFSV